MATTGHYVAWRVRVSAIPYVKAYGECALRDVVAAFGDLERRAEEVANAAFERYGAQPAGEDFDGDMGAFAERAQDEGIAFYQTMFAIRQSTLNLFSVGLFHLVEQQLADLCRDASFEVAPPGDTKIPVVARWYSDHFGLDLSTVPGWAAMDELRLVANTVKHAEGGSTERLRNIRPQLFQHPAVRELLPEEDFGANLPVHLPLAGESLYVSEEFFRGYSEAANGFFESIANHFDEHGDAYYPH